MLFSALIGINAAMALAGAIGTIIPRMHSSSQGKTLTVRYIHVYNPEFRPFSLDWARIPSKFRREETDMRILTFQSSNSVLQERSPGLFEEIRANYPRVLQPLGP